MERLICFLPNEPKPNEPSDPWDTMSDQYKSTLWDINPRHDMTVCGIGENDTVIVDGLRGALIQWSSFSSVHTSKRIGWRRMALIYLIAFAPLLLIIALPIFAISKEVAGILLAISLVILLSAPLYIPRLYTGKLYEVEPCLFGIEGYVPLPHVEEALFGARMGRLKWSPYGSPLSRHRPSREGYRERLVDADFDIKDNGDVESQQSLLDSEVYTYPVESLDPCSPCENCSEEGEKCTHLTYEEAEKISKSDYGQMKV
jgi:hypothetical protein